MGKTEAQIPIEKIATGNSFVVKGEVSENPRRFSIDFIDVIHGETLLSITADFKQKEVVRNSDLERDAGWGTKETGGDFPFHASMKFEIVVTVEAPYFSISINNNAYCTYRHRAPYNKINTLRISGDVVIEELTLEGCIYKSNKSGGPLVKYSAAGSRESTTDAGPSNIPTSAPSAAALPPLPAAKEDSSAAQAQKTAASSKQTIAPVNPVVTQKLRTSTDLQKVAETPGKVTSTLNPRSELDLQKPIDLTANTDAKASTMNLRTRGPTSISQLAKGSSLNVKPKIDPNMPQEEERQHRSRSKSTCCSVT